MLTTKAPATGATPTQAFRPGNPRHLQRAAARFGQQQGEDPGVLVSADALRGRGVRWVPHNLDQRRGLLAECRVEDLGRAAGAAAQCRDRAACDSATSHSAMMPGRSGRAVTLATLVICSIIAAGLKPCQNCDQPYPNRLIS
jgi:hypothetical protein